MVGEMRSGEKRPSNDAGVDRDGGDVCSVIAKK